MSPIVVLVQHLIDARAEHQCLRWLQAVRSAFGTYYFSNERSGEVVAERRPTMREVGVPQRGNRGATQSATRKRACGVTLARDAVVQPDDARAIASSDSSAKPGARK